MFKIDKFNTIELTRGDSAVIELSLDAYFDDGRKHCYRPQIGDEIILTVRATRDCSDKILFQKSLREKSYFLIDPKDTRHLETGNYYYDIQLTTADKDVFTVVPLSKFKILREVCDNA